MCLHHSALSIPAIHNTNAIAQAAIIISPIKFYFPVIFRSYQLELAHFGFSFHFRSIYLYIRGKVFFLFVFTYEEMSCFYLCLHLRKWLFFICLYIRGNIFSSFVFTYEKIFFSLHMRKCLFLFYTYEEMSIFICIYWWENVFSVFLYMWGNVYFDLSLNMRKFLFFYLSLLMIESLS